METLDLKYFKEHGIDKDYSETSSRIWSYYKNQTQKDFKLLAAAPYPGDEYEYVSIAEYRKWSPYSDRGRIIVGYWKPGEPDPCRLSVSDLDYDEAEADRTVIKLCMDNDELKQAVQSHSFYKMENIFADMNNVPYIIAHRVNFDRVVPLISENPDADVIPFC